MHEQEEIGLNPFFMQGLPLFYGSFFVFTIFSSSPILLSSVGYDIFLAVLTV